MRDMKKNIFGVCGLCVFAFVVMVAAPILSPTQAVDAQNLHRSRFELVQPKYLHVEKTSELVGDVEITAGDLDLTAGDLTLTAGDLTLTAGDLTLTAGDFTAVDITSTDDITAGDDLVVTDDVSIGGNLSSSNTAPLEVTASLALVPGATATITAGLTIPHSNQSLLWIDAASAVDTSSSAAIAAGTVEGQTLGIMNSNTYVITVKNNAASQFGGDIALGVYDYLQVVWDGSSWVRMFSTDN